MIRQDVEKFQISGISLFCSMFSINVLNLIKIFQYYGFFLDLDLDNLVYVKKAKASIKKRKKRQPIVLYRAKSFVEGRFK